jgi:nitrile hydratase accessory protein
LKGCEPPLLDLGPAIAADRPEVFAAPWEAQAFAMAVALHQRGLFTWEQWAETLSREIGRTPKLGEPDDGRGYYACWLRALERIVVEKGVASAGMLAVLRERWDEAARTTPHGEPVTLA